MPSKEILPDKYRDEDYGDQGVNDDAGEWNPDAFLNTLGDGPVTLEQLVTYLEEENILETGSLQAPWEMDVTVEELVKRVKEARK